MAEIPGATGTASTTGSAGTAGTVVVGVADPAHSLAAVDAAAVEAYLRSCPLTLLSVCPFPDHTGPVTLLSVLSRRVATAWPEVTVSARNVTGRPDTVLLAASHAAELVVVGRRRRGRPLGPVPGSVGREVASYATCPVMIAPAGAPASTDDPVLVAVSGEGGHDEHAVLRRGFDEASARRVGLVAVHVWSGVPPTGLPSVDPFAYRDAGAREAADRLLAESLAGWAEHYPDVAVERLPIHDADPARALREAGSRAGLLVVGGRRLHRYRAHPLGTVTTTLIAEAGRPVLAVPAPDTAPLSGTVDPVRAWTG